MDPSLLRKVDNSYIYGYYCTSPMLWEKLVGLAVGLVMVGLTVGLDVVGELVGLAVGMGRPETSPSCGACYPAPCQIFAWDLWVAWVEERPYEKNLVSPNGLIYLCCLLVSNSCQKDPRVVYLPWFVGA